MNNTSILCEAKRREGQNQWHRTSSCAFWEIFFSPERARSTPRWGMFNAEISPFQGFRKISFFYVGLLPYAGDRVLSGLLDIVWQYVAVSD